MPTLISVHNSKGCIGRCDAKCYNATQPKCKCVCGGVNHGAGLSNAISNTQELKLDQIEKAPRFKDNPPAVLQKDYELDQRASLFPPNPYLGGQL